MPFLPMKYPEYRITMEAALPSSVHSWLNHELEQLGIDSLVYTRYIISLLLQDPEDLEGLDTDLDAFPKSKRKGRKSEKQKHLSASDEERKKFAAIQCLSDITEEKAGIETLVDELCSRLKDSEIKASVSPDSKSRSCSSDGSDVSGEEKQNPAQKYYAAFPALHGQDATCNLSPSETIWRNNPLVRIQTSEEDTSSANEDAEIRKINIPCPVAVPKHRKPRKNNSRSKKDRHDPGRRREKSAGGNYSRGKKIHVEKQDLPAWPPGFAKLDPLILQSLDLVDDVFPSETEKPVRAKDELCTKVESILKGMLLPAPEKTYKDLVDVDFSPTEMRDKIEKASSKQTISFTPVENQAEVEETDMESIKIKAEGFDGVETLSASPRDESVSPELQEQEIWYTQPIDVIFHGQDDEVSSSSKLRLYKRLSDPASSPDADAESTSDTTFECFNNSTSSPIVCARKRSQSFASDKSDDIWEGSLLIPAWLTEVISTDDNCDTNIEDIDLAHSLKSSSPFAECDSGLGLSKLADLSMSDDGFNFKNADNVWKHASEEDDYVKFGLLNDNGNCFDDNCTPTPDGGGIYPPGRPGSVSLVDWDYMSKFLNGEPNWQSYSPEESLQFHSPRRACITALWQSQVLFDCSLYMPCSMTDLVPPVYELNDVQCWQPIGSSPFSQLWDVNMQKRSKMSSWGGQIFHSDSQVWFAENTLVFLHNVPDFDIDIGGFEHGENTLIPRISIDIVSETDTDGSSFLNEDDGDEDRSFPYFDRSVSMGDVPSLWADDQPRTVDPKLSKSFELVPSEYSAFNDVPRKLLHVHSEPNLVQFRQDFVDGNQSGVQSPQEHLYFSPKTHFRPITPAYVPELFTSKSKQQVCHDLFGGLPSTKTPYQEYQVLDKDRESDEESFIPRFKVKNYSKCVQTGESFEKLDSPMESNEMLERDTPETLTLSMIEDVIEEKIDTLMSISEDLDTANTDSAYETDYGGNIGTDFDHDHHSTNCCNKDIEGNVSMYGSSNLDHGNLGDVIKFSVQSFVATFPHTNDWPDVSVQHAESRWTETEVDYPYESWPQPEYPNVVKDDENIESSYKSHGIWGDDLGLDHLYKESEMEKYKNIWSSAGHDYYSVDAVAPENLSHVDGSDVLNEEYDDDEGDNYYGNLIMEAYNGNDLYDYQPMLEPGDQMIETLPETEGVFPIYAGFPETDEVPVPSEMALTPETDTGEYFSVKLVYKDKQANEGEQQQNQSYGTYELMPMPDEGVMSTELEKQWMDPSIRAMWAGRKPSSAQRKPCSFYLEGNCRRSDCKFAHDISNITCRFWEEGGCFKGPLCPFLHGYPRLGSPTKENDSPVEVDKEKFDLNNEEFPELSLSVKNGNNNNSAPKKSKCSKVQNILSGGRREKSRKGSAARRHSNKENRCEVNIIEKCCSSI
ncbi:uncharacterized protein LOC132724601 [Ruditapes philippinarum]|uniref:uncharacterized protein LOC132724601 n=1 Tax=Ruditapes philippinarum TaxID=129788 RepID=UPI00295BEF87|nr:uncharacterized protein LOC132724601 [Ruditapes philippinarum]